MAKSQVTTETETAPVATLPNVVALYSTPGSGDRVSDIYALAHDAFGVGHRTYDCVPFPRSHHAGDQMTEAEAFWLDVSAVRAGLGNKDYTSVNEVASLRPTIATQYSLLEDCVDAIVKAEIVKSGKVAGTREDRVQHVVRFLRAKPSARLKASGLTLGEAISAGLTEMISKRKEVKGSKSGNGAAPDVSGNDDLLLDDDE